VNTKAHSLPQKNQCAVCKIQQKITVCTGCRVAHYCGSAHQKLGWAKHKWLCKAVRVSIGHVTELTADVEREIQASGGDYEAYFRSCPPAAESFLQFKSILARNYVKVGTLAGTLEGLKHFLEIDRLSVGANAKEVRLQTSDFIPGLLLRLGWDQECYNFLKEKCNGKLEAIYRCDINTSFPVRPANAENFSLAHASMLCGLKLRIIEDLHNLHQADIALGNNLPAELFTEVRSYLISEAMRTQPDLMEGIDARVPLPDFIKVFCWDVRNLRHYVDALDIDYWDALQYPDEYMKMQPMHDSELPIAAALGQTFDTWAETPGSFALFDGICAAWGRGVGLRPCFKV
jgi:hypothetical protein